MLKVGVIGAGALGRHHARIYSELDGVALKGIADIRLDRAVEVAARYGGAPMADYRELLGEVDAVSIAAPTEDHASIAVACLEAGVDVLVEKPIAADPAAAKGMIEAAEKRGRLLQVGHVERFNPIVEAARQAATQPQFFEVHRLNAFSMRSLDIDVVLDLMIHDIDIIHSLVAVPLAEIRAVGIPVLSDKADIANVRLQFENGCVANMTASRVSTEKVRKLRFFQPHDYVSIDYAAQEGVLLSLEGGRIRRQALAPRRAEPLRRELEAFTACVRDRTPPAVTGEDGLRALVTALAVNRAIEVERSRLKNGASPP